MGIHTSESDGIINTGPGIYGNSGSFAIILIAIGSILIILCAASIIYGLHRRRRQGATVTGGMWYSNYIKLQNSFTKKKLQWMIFIMLIYKKKKIFLYFSVINLEFISKY